MDSIQVIHTGSPKIYIEDVERRPNLVFLLHVRSADRKLIKFWFLFLLGFITRQTAVVIIRLGYTHRFYKNAFSKTVLDTYTV